MKLILKISAILLALVVITSSLGISVFLHTCNSSKSTKYSFFEKPVSCCSTHQTEENNLDKVENPQCCNNIFYFFKMHVNAFQNYNVAAIFSTLFIALPFDIKAYSKLVKTLHETLFMAHAPPLLRPGKLFIYFIQSIKIPSPVL